LWKSLQAYFPARESCGSHCRPISQHGKVVEVTAGLFPSTGKLWKSLQAYFPARESCGSHCRPISQPSRHQAYGHRQTATQRRKCFHVCCKKNPCSVQCAVCCSKTVAVCSERCVATKSLQRAVCSAQARVQVRRRNVVRSRCPCAAGVLARRTRLHQTAGRGKAARAPRKRKSATLRGNNARRQLEGRRGVPRLWPCASAAKAGHTQGTCHLDQSGRMAV